MEVKYSVPEPEFSDRSVFTYSETPGSESDAHRFAMPVKTTCELANLHEATVTSRNYWRGVTKLGDSQNVHRFVFLQKYDRHTTNRQL